MSIPKWVYELSERILIDSIKYPTVLGESYKEIVEYYAEILKKYGIHTTIYRVPDDYVRRVLPPQMRPEKPRYILLARVGSGERVIQFNGHYDVVASGSGWSVTEPFTPKKVDGKIYGRGASDMKGGIASFLAALAYIASTKEPKDHVVEAALVPDEEIGGMTGTGYLVRELGSRPTWAVIAEPSSLHTIWIGHKGAIWMEVRVKGKQTHGSTPWLGINAFEKMVYVARYLIEKAKPIIESRRSSYTYDMPESAKPTLVLGGRVTSAGSVNIVPGEVSFTIDRRLIVEERPEEAENELKRFIEEAAREAGAEIEVKTLIKFNPALTRPDTPLVKTLLKISGKVVGKEPKVIVCTGGLDLHYYSGAGVQVVAYGPGKPEQAHIVNEYIDVADMYKAIDVYVELALTTPG